MLRWSLLLCLVVAGSVSLPAREGYVRTRDGKLLEGQIRFESNSVVVVNLRRGVWSQFPFSNLVSLALEPERPTAAAAETIFARQANPEGWRSDDVGWTERAGGADGHSGSLRVWSGGTNMFGDADSFHFVSKGVQGDRQVAGRVLRFPGVIASSFAGFSIREGLGAAAKQVSVGLDSGQRVLFGWRDRPGAMATISVDPSGAAGPQWLKLSRRGNTFAAFRSGDGRRWHPVGRTLVPMGDDVQIGIAVAGGDPGRVAESLIQRVDEGRLLKALSPVPRIDLIGGSTQHGHVESLDDSSVQISGMGGLNSLATKAVSAIRFGTVPQRFFKLMSGGQPGVLLDDGQFIDAEIRNVRNGYVTISSVPLGLRHYDLHSEVVAVIFRPRGLPARHPCRLLTTDGSIWMGTELAVEGNWVLIREAGYGIRRVPIYEVAELRWSS
jgi:hypothetical protein